MNNSQILIVDNDAQSASDLSKGLEKFDCSIVGLASTTEEAVSMCTSPFPDIILSSINLWEQLKSSSSASMRTLFKNVPVLLFLDPESHENPLDIADQSNFYGFLQKPVDPRAACMMARIAVSKHKKDLDRLSMSNVFRFADIIEKSTTGIYMVDNNYHLLYANDTLCHILGRDRSEIIGHSFTEFLGESRDLVIERYKAKQAGEYAPSEYEIDIVRKTGEVRNLLISTSPVVNDNGINKSSGHLLDITEQKRANMELAKLSLVVEQSPVMTLITDRLGNIEYANREFQRITGYALKELLGNNPRILKSGIHDQAFYKDLWDTITSGQTWTGELTNKMKDGSILWERASIAPIRDLQGNITHYVALKENITQYKEEQKVALKNQQLRDIQYEITSAAIKSEDVSVLYEKIYHYISEIISTSNFFMALLDKEQNRIIFPFDKDTFETELPESIPCDPDQSLTAKTIVSGKTLHLSSEEILKLKDEGQMLIAGDIPSVWLGIPLILRDEVIGAFVLQEYYGITRYAEEDVRMLELAAGQVALTIDRARKDDALRTLAEELRSTNDIKELLLDVITHDLRNPAGVIKTITEVLDAENRNDELISTLKSSGDNLIKVIDNASVLSKVNVGESIAKESLDLVNILHEVSAEFSSQLSINKMTLDFQMPDSLPIEANPIISEIPKNYISNAIKYGSPGGKIEIIVKTEGDRPVMRIEDRGQPVPQDKREIIFQRFTRLEGHQKKGRGLGLAIVKRIADAHDAEVGIEQSVHGGNSFYLKL
ncbi:MAG: PAS domain S-box protein [Candidatus Marinimicrobia bacterium]|nr:PAS domain S-box protein [Candidatus Neomarinimicrobiota bacterium]